MHQASLGTSAEAPAAVLSVEGLSKRFGGVVAVDDCSFEVERGSVVGIIGPNGSGKSTLFNLLTSVLRPDRGVVRYRGERIDGLPLYEIARKGIGRTYQSVRIFRDLPVWMNLEIAAMGRGRSAWEVPARQWLERFGLTHLVGDASDTLSVGQQRLLELAMNLAMSPDLLLLDEPLAGVNPVVRDTIADAVVALRREGKTFLIIEHHMNFVMRLCDKIVVMDHGEKIAEGTPESIREDARVINALLGKRAAQA
ncbi:ABC transporter ATP-binding protein [Reyranella sp.]|uniref:ABC transporter ATP-binding protein n=1 Tax=Reyranella sp. TaxID=1929291 RepID=UPI002F95C85B